MTEKNYLLAFITASALLTGCCVHGTGDIEEQDREIGTFENLRVDVPATVYLSRGDSDTIRIRTDDNIFDHLTTEVRDGTLVIQGDDRDDCLDPTTLSIWATTQTIRSVEIDGSATVVLEDDFETDHLRMTIDGSGELVSKGTIVSDEVVVSIDGSGSAHLAVDVLDMHSHVDGSADIYLSGSAAFHDIQIDGSGKVRAFDMATATTTIDVDGSANCQVTVQDELNVTIDGSGTVSYRGSPVVNQKIDGSGSVKNAN